MPVHVPSETQKETPVGLEEIQDTVEVRLFSGGPRNIMVSFARSYSTVQFLKHKFAYDLVTRSLRSEVVGSFMPNLSKSNLCFFNSS
jgi:hypothetical protein